MRTNRRMLAALLLALPLAARAQVLPTALIWIPAEGFSQWASVDAALRSRDVKLTIALTPAMATPQVKQIMGPWAHSGRVEFAARIPGDPILPFVASHPQAPRPDDALERAAQARQEIEKSLGVGPLGIVPGAGAIDVSLVGPLSATGAPWVLAGPYAVADAPWAAAGRAVFVPARAAPQGSVTSEDLLTPGALVFDETIATSAAQSPLLAAIPTLGWFTKPPKGWATVSQLAAPAGAKRVNAATVSPWPAWDGFPLSAPAPAAQAAWEAYGAAARAVAQYRDSGTADLTVLEETSNLLRQAQDARFFRASEAGVPAELRERLLKVYRRVRLTAPQALYKGGSPYSLAGGGDPVAMRAGSGPGWLAFDNPRGSLTTTPVGAASPDPWRLRGLRVEWDAERILFRIFIGRVDATPPSPHPIYDVYLDFNHMVGAGAVQLLEGRSAFAAARDAWEYALTVSGTDVHLYRATPSGDAEEVTRLTSELDPAHAEVRVSVPRAQLRGNPARWGYIVLTLAEDPRRAGRTPPAVYADADGKSVLALLAPLDAQKTFFHPPVPKPVLTPGTTQPVLPPSNAPQRVSAARLEDSP